MTDTFRDSDIIVHSGQKIPRDRVTKGVAITDTNHSQVHAGNAFSINEKLSLGNGASKTVTLDVPAGVYVHMQLVAAILSQSFSITLTEGDTPTTGTEGSIIGRNRISGQASALTYHDTAVSANTTTLVDLERTASINAGTGVLSDGIEWVFKPGLSYTVVITNETASAGTGSFAIEWYEEGAGFAG